MNEEINWNTLAGQLKGELRYDKTIRKVYATDASPYRDEPLAVAYPRDKEDIRVIVKFANAENIAITPRAGGTSLAGQAIGRGLIVDISRHMNRIVELNTEERWVKVQPGVILDDLNRALRPHDLMFAPETSTGNRCTIGGMAGNNSCGAHSIIYGSTRDHLIGMSCILSDGSEAHFTDLNAEGFRNKCKQDDLEGKVYKSIDSILSDEENRLEILGQYPDQEIKRRNTGYALDMLMDSDPFKGNLRRFNMCRLLAGSEGTLAFSTELKLNLIPLPPPEKAVVVIHFASLERALRGNITVLKYHPASVELIDSKVLERAWTNISLSRERSFIEDKPEAVLAVEFFGENKGEILKKTKYMIDDLQKEGVGYHFPVLFNKDTDKIWNLRKAGLGVLSNIPGDAKPVAIIEDTAIHPAKLPAFVSDLKEILAEMGLDCVYYGHIATGELHLRPILNLKDPADVKKFNAIGRETALLTKKYGGSFSGEHGDGRLRAEYLPMLFGEKVYQIFVDVKKSWDPQNIFNPGIKTDAPANTERLRYVPGQDTVEFDTILDYSATQGYMRAIEQCNGSGDCRKPAQAGGTLCPSYQATGDETATTRARANLLRELLSKPETKKAFAQKEIYDILQLCLSCKACKSECPSNVDMANLKAEYLQHYYDHKGVPFRVRIIANINLFNRMGSVFPWLYNNLISKGIVSKLIKRIMGFAPKRNFPSLARHSLRKWIRKHPEYFVPKQQPVAKVLFFVDEFTNYYDVAIGIKTIELLEGLGYQLRTVRHWESGRASLSKGLLRKARRLADKNVRQISDVIEADELLVGLEPSAILSFRDEYPRLVSKSLRPAAESLAAKTYTVDEFLAGQMDEGKIRADDFTDAPLHSLFHGHCQQKAVAGTSHALRIMSFPKNYTVEEIKSGCCGMAGSFGYDRKNYKLSMKIGEMVLFPAIRRKNPKQKLTASGTSCRHQIKDGTGQKAFHPVEVLWKAWKEGRG